jgi:Sec-independent protein translocase protein TatA
VFGLSTGEIIVVALIVTLVFGWSWFPRIGEKVGDLLGGVKKGLREDDERIVVKQAEPPKKKPAPRDPE